MMLKKITLKIATKTFGFGTAKQEIEVDEVCVWAWVDGAFAIHRGIGNEHSEDQSPQHWVLTHIPTSAICGSSRAKQPIIDKMHELKKWQFAGRPLEEAKACDIVEFATIIPRMNGKNYRKGKVEDYIKNTKPLFEAALGC